MFNMYRYRIHENIALHPYKAIYFYIPKVACSSLKLLYSELLGIKPLDPRNPSKYPHWRRYPYVKRSELPKYDDYFKFAFVRNPWDRIVSCYYNKIIETPTTTGFGYIQGVPRFLRKYKKFSKDMDFTNFVECICEIPDDFADPHFRSQWTFIAHNGEIITDYVGRFEFLEQDLGHVHDVIHVHDVTLPHLSKSNRNKYHDYYNDHSRKLVAMRYEADIDHFKYTY